MTVGPYTYAGAAGALLVLAIAGAGVYMSGMLTPSLPSAQPSPEQGGRFVYARGNFSLAPVSGWTLEADKHLLLPKGFTGLRFAFKKDGSPCILAYAEGDIAEPSMDSYKQTTPGERVYLGNAQLDPWWWAPRSALSPGFEPQFSGRLPFPGEVQVSTARYVVPNASGSASFLLYARDGGRVPDGCDMEATQILRSFEEVFTPAELTPRSEGLLRLLPSHASGTYLLAFRPSGSESFGQVSQRGEVGYVSTVFGDQLYFKQNGSLMTYDVFAQRADPLPGVATSSQRSVIDFQIRDGRLWYLLGQRGCDEYMAKCLLNAYEIPARGGEPVLLASDVKLESGSVMGFDAVRNVLYLRSSFGDAGCYSYEIYQYAYESREILKVLSDAGCEGDAPGAHAAAQAHLSAIQAAIGAATTSSAVRVSRGRLLVPTGQDAAGQIGTGNFVFPL